MLSELEFVLNKVGCKALVISPTFKSSDYVAMLRQLAPEIASPVSPASCRSARLPMLRLVILTDDAPPPGFLSISATVDALGQTAGSSRVREVRQNLQPEDAVNIQFTSGTTGAAEGRDALTSQHRQQRLLRSTSHEIHARRIGSLFRCRCITASAWSWACSGALTHGAAMMFPREGFDP